MRIPAELMLISVLGFAQGALAEDSAANLANGAPSKRTAAPHKLDLRLPDIRTIFSPDVIDQVLSKARDRDTIEEVEVEGVRTRIAPGTPDVPAGWFSAFWAFAHPSDAWRIFAPLPPDRAQLVATSFDATDSYRAAPMPRGIAIGDY